VCIEKEKDEDEITRMTQANRYARMEEQQNVGGWCINIKRPYNYPLNVNFLATLVDNIEQFENESGTLIHEKLLHHESDSKYPFPQWWSVYGFLDGW
jgi:hypothetical protein